MITLKSAINLNTKEEEIVILRDGVMIATFNAHDKTKSLPVVVMSITSKDIIDFKVKSSDVLYPDGKLRKVKAIAVILDPKDE